MVNSIPPVRQIVRHQTQSGVRHDSGIVSVTPVGRGISDEIDVRNDLLWPQRAKGHTFECRFSELTDPCRPEILKSFPPVRVRISQNLSPL